MSAVAIDDKAVPGARKPGCEPREYLYNLNKTAIYVAARGLPFLLVTHAIFLVRYIDEWVENDTRNAVDAAGALFGRWPKWSQKLIAEWLQKTWLPSGILLAVLLAPYVLPLAVVLPYQVGRSVLSSTWDIFRNGIRALPPLVTAVVVVFVTSDAWRILGNGSANRFWLLIAVFVAASLLFLIRWRCWDDIDVSPKQVDKLLGGITLKRPTGFRAFIDPDYGVQPAPINRPGPLGTVWVYTGYWLLAAFALLMTMAFVALALIVVGVILINKNETITLANSAHVYHTMPGLVITRQLLLLSASLAAFAAFFLVAAQKPTDRKRFMRNVLVRYRRVLLVYTVYCAAHDHAAPWTQVEVRDKPLDRRESGSGRVRRRRGVHAAPDH